MSFFKVYSAQAELLSAKQIDIEIDITRGLYSFNIVGLGDRSVIESRDRISSAIKYTGFKSPKQKNQKVIISLAPANQKKTGTYFDIPIAIGYLAASKEISFESKNKLFVGELSLDGDTRRIKGVMQITNFAKDNGFKEIYIPYENAEEASFIKGIDIYPVKNLAELISHLINKKIIKKYLNKETITKEQEPLIIDFSEIKGQEIAKRALLIAASGNHNIALYGPPGTGKTMLARAFVGILPPLRKEQMVQSTSIYSLSGMLNESIINEPPFRSPHHTSSYSSIIGGKSTHIPGEITLAHNGVLFLDELPEFDKRVINSLRQPLEEKSILISRVNESIKYPANFILVAAMNPCPCGYNQTNIKKCICNPYQIHQYQTKIPNPIIDRIDMWVEVTNINEEEIIRNNSEGENISNILKNKVVNCRNLQLKNLGKLNGELTSKDIEKIVIKDEAKENLMRIYKAYKLSMRSYYKIIKIARTIANLEGSLEIKKPHILEAVQFRYKKY